MTEFNPKTPIDNIDNALSEVFNTEPLQGEIMAAPAKDIVITPEVPKDGQLDADLQHARGNMYDLLESGKDALQYAIELAKQTDSPRGFEVVAGMLKTLSDMNMQLLEAHERKQKAQKSVKVETVGEGPSSVVNNNSVFVGSTAELAKMIETMGNKGK